MATDPFAPVRTWFAEAQAGEPNDPDAMSLATVDADGRPSVRMVLLKGLAPGLRLLHQPRSAQGRASWARNPRAALLFHWKPLGRQVRVEGAGRARDRAEADAYFATRARDSQLGAWASEQSRPLDSRATFEARLEQCKRQFEGRTSRVLRTGAAIASCRDASSSGRIARIASTSGACSGSRATAGPKGCSTHDEPRNHPGGTFTAHPARGVGEHCDGGHPDRLESVGSGANIVDGDARLACRHRSTSSPAVMLLGVRIAALPADHDHRFGHGKAEALAALVQVILITLSAVFIGYRAVERLLSGAQTADANSESACRSWRWC